MDWLTLRIKRAGPRDGPSVLVVEDEQSMRDFLKRTLTTLGYNLLVAPDSESALRLLSEQPQVALLDVHLPGASGLWLADQIRDLSPTTAIILVTGDSRVAPTESLRPQVVGYILKPFAIEKLRETVAAGVLWSEGRRRKR